MIKQEVIDDIFSNVQIEKIIGKEITLKKNGANYKGNCPFHNEKTPSFTVSPAKNRFKCFGCGEGGDAVSFIMKHKGFTFIEAIRFIASDMNILIEEEKADPLAVEKAAKRDSLKLFNEYAQAFYIQNLKVNTDAQAYISGRLSIESIETFQLGFAPKGFNALFRSSREAGYLEDFIIHSGLVSKSIKTDTIYDFFQNRITFPIFNQSGTLIGFSGRKLPDEDGKNDEIDHLNSV